MGTGGAVNIPRPDRLESAYVRLANGGQQVDYMLDIVQAREDYNEIALKQLQTFP